MAASKRKKKYSTKELEGKRVGGILYLKRGVGSGAFNNQTIGSGTVSNIANVKGRRDDY